MLDIGKEVYQEIEKTYMLMSHYQDVGQRYNIKANKFFENVARFISLRMSVTKITFMKDLRNSLNLGNACCHVVHIRGEEIWAYTLKEQRRLGVLENQVLRRIFRCKREEVTLRIFIICILLQMDYQITI
jgi:hypothetical protein